MKTEIIEKKVPNKTLSQGLILLHFLTIVLLALIAYLVFKKDFVGINPYIKNLPKGVFLLYSTLFILMLILSVVVHELIHGYFFAIYNHSGWKAVKFGFNKELMSPYATCQEPVKVKQFRIIVAMPTLILGIIPLLISLFYHNLVIFFFSAIMIVSGTGDILVLWVIRKLSANRYLIDHPGALGYFLVNNYEIYELPEIKEYIQLVGVQKQTQTKKSNNTKIFFIIFITSMLISIIAKKFLLK